MQQPTSRRRAAIAEQLDDLIDDNEFSRFQAHSLVIFATPENVPRTFRVPNAFEPLVIVSDRFHVKPLLRSVSLPQSCYVLALVQKSVRVIEVSPDLPSAAVQVEGMPEDAGRAVRGVGEIGDWPKSPRPRLRARAGVRGAGGYWPSGRIQAVEGQKVLLRQFARNIDKALRPLLTGSGIPLVLAAAEPLASVYRSVNTYTGLAEATIEGTRKPLPMPSSGSGRGRFWMDFTAKSLQPGEPFSRFARTRAGLPRTSLRRPGPRLWAPWSSMLVDIDEVVPGRIDEDGAIVFAEQANASNYELVDEIATRVISTGGRVIGVRKTDIPGLVAPAVVMRYLCDLDRLADVIVCANPNFHLEVQMASPYINDQAARTETATALGRLLADSYMLYLKTHGFHWNVVGPQFEPLHTLFQEQYTESRRR